VASPEEVGWPYISPLWERFPVWYLLGKAIYWAGEPEFQKLASRSVVSGQGASIYGFCARRMLVVFSITRNGNLRVNGDS